MAEKTRFYYLSVNNEDGKVMGCMPFDLFDGVHCIHRAKAKVDQWNLIMKKLDFAFHYALSSTPTLDTSSKKVL